MGYKRSKYEIQLDLNWRVSEKFWIKERGLTEKQYEQVIKICSGSSCGFCESCMGKEVCEMKVRGELKEKLLSVN